MRHLSHAGANMNSSTAPYRPQCSLQTQCERVATNRLITYSQLHHVSPEGGAREKIIGWLNRLLSRKVQAILAFDFFISFLFLDFLLRARLWSRPGVVDTSSSRTNRLVGAPTTFNDFIIDQSFKYQSGFTCDTDGNSRHWTRFTHQTRFFDIRTAPKVPTDHELQHLLSSAPGPLIRDIIMKTSKRRDCSTSCFCPDCYRFRRSF